MEGDEYIYFTSFERKLLNFQVVHQGEMFAIFRRKDGHLLSHAPNKKQERINANFKRQSRRNR